MTMLAIPPPTSIRDDARPAALFDTLHPLSSTLPLAGCVEDPVYRALVAELGCPSRAALDARVGVLEICGGRVVAGAVLVDGPPTLPLPLSKATS